MNNSPIRCFTTAIPFADSGSSSSLAAVYFFRCHGAEMTKKSAFHVMCGKEKKLECMTMPVTSYLADRLFTERTFATLISATPFFSLHHNDFTSRAKDVGSSAGKEFKIETSPLLNTSH